MSSPNCSENPRNRMPAALSVAGSDSSGGAGIQADLAAFSYFHVHGTTSITAVTAQSPATVTDVIPIPPEGVCEQMRIVFRDINVNAVKTGMLHNRDIIESIDTTLREYQPTLVVDPVFRAESGAELLDPDAVVSLTQKLFPQATLITPNRREAEKLRGQAIEDWDDMMRAAQELADTYSTCVLLKGGHMTSDQESVDILATEQDIWCVKAPLIATPLSTHGSGCALSAAITACLANGMPLAEAVQTARAYIVEAIRSGVRIGQETTAMGRPQRLPVEDVTFSRCHL